MLYDIVIPHYNIDPANALAVTCLKTIRIYSKDYRVIWVQNGGEVPAPITHELLQLEKILIIKNETNLGFVKAANQGLRASEAQFVVLLNNDTEAMTNWLEELSKPLVWPMVMSGPRTTATGSWQGHAPAGTGIRTIPRGAMLAFFCVMFDRRVFDVVGYLDEDFGVGFGDDDNYCARVHKVGLRMCLVARLVIPHKHRSTFRAIYAPEEIRRMQDDAMQLYKDKLSKLT